MEALGPLTEALKIGGPWSLVVVLLAAVLKLYTDSQRQHREFLSKVIGLVESQTEASTKMEATLASTKDLILAISRE